MKTKNLLMAAVAAFLCVSFASCSGSNNGKGDNILPEVTETYNVTVYIPVTNHQLDYLDETITIENKGVAIATAKVNDLPTVADANLPKDAKGSLDIMFKAFGDLMGKHFSDEAVICKVYKLSAPMEHSSLKAKIGLKAKNVAGGDFSLNVGLSSYFVVTSSLTNQMKTNGVSETGAYAPAAEYSNLCGFCDMMNNQNMNFAYISF